MYAIVQLGGPVHGIGETIDQAITNYENEQGPFETPPEYLEFCEGLALDALVIIPCSTLLYDEVERIGGDIIWHIFAGQAITEYEFDLL